MSFGGAGQGNIRYSIILDDTAAVQKIGQFKTALNGITQPSQALATNIGTLNTNFATISTGLGTTNTGFKTLGTGINGLTTPTRTLGTNMGVLNNNFKAFTTTEAQTVTQTNTFKTGITALTTPTQTLGTNMKSLVGSVGPLAGNFQKTTGAAKDMVVQQNNLSTGSTSLGSKVKSAASQYGQFAVNLGTVATSAIQLIRNYRDLEDTQIAVDKSAKKLSTAHEAVDKITIKLKEDTIKYGKNSKQVKQDTLDLSQATQTLSITEKVHGENLERQSDAYQDFSTSIIPTVISTVGTASSGFSDLGKNIKAGIPGIKNFGGSIKGLPGILKLTATGAISASGGLLGFASNAGPIAGLINNIRIAIDLLPKTFSLFTGDISTRIGIVKQWMDGLKNLSVTGGLAEILDKLAGISPELDKVSKSMQGAAKPTKELQAAESKLAEITARLTPLTKSHVTAIANDAKAQIAAAQADVDRLKAVNNLTPGIIGLGKGIKVVADNTNTAQNAGGGLFATLSDIGSEAAKLEKQTTDLNIAFQSQFETMQDAAPKNLFELLAKGGPIIQTLGDETKAADPPMKALIGTLNKGGPVMNDFLGAAKPLGPAFVDAADKAAVIQRVIDKVNKVMLVGKDAIDAYAAAQEKAKAKADAFAQSVQTAREGLQKAFHIKLDDPDKFLKQFEKLLPNKISKKVKLNLDFTKSIPKITKDIQNVFLEASQFDDSTADAMAKTLIKTLDKSFGKKTEKAFPGLTAAIKAAIADPNTPAALAKLIETYPWLANIKEIPVPSTFIPPTTPIPSPDKSVKVPSTFIPPPPPPAPKTPVKIPAVLDFGGSSNITRGSQAGAYGGPGKIGFGQRGTDDKGKKLKKIGGQYPNEFTQGGNDFQNRLDNARHKPEPEEDLGTHPIQGWPVSSGGGKTSNATPQINIEMALKQIDVLAKRLIGLSAIMPVITLNNAAAIKAIDVIAIRLSTLTAIQPVITLINNTAIQAIDVIATRIMSLAGLQPQITLLNNNAITSISTVSGEIDKLGKIQPQIGLKNNNAISAIDTAAGEIKALTKLKPQISLQNRNAINAIQTVEGEIKNLTKLKPQISLQNRNAISAIQTVESEIKKLENIKPHINVTVGVTGPGVKFLATGIHGTVSKPTLFLAGEAGPERIDVGPASGQGTGLTYDKSVSVKPIGSVYRGRESEPSGSNNVTEVHVHVMDDTIIRKITARSGRNRFTMGV